ncbi:MAG: hypothetical protein EOO06_14055 [Chitinophagaceae bacterium]|nr:MAG: hypothetical protein EOO06_14055 [Chitinophagaceae bacterium]
MKLEPTIEKFSFAQVELSLLVPDLIKVQQSFQQAPEQPVPFWAKLWPASIALCDYLSRHQSLLLHSTVLELGAGLGLPSLYAAHFAKEVLCTDLDQQAMELAAASARLNNLNNIECKMLDWADAAETTAQLVLLSDVNYDPSSFAKLRFVVENLLERGTGIVISTPQRLMAKPFIAQLSDACVDRTTIPVNFNAVSKEIFIMHLQR